jgi:mono/diheme cytochrome c family protein
MRHSTYALAALLLVLAFVGAGAADPAKSVAITETSFKCIRDLHAVRGFYVDNLLGNLDGTLAVANSPTGGVYPPGSLVQLLPGEVMVKREAGFNAATHDWEFFELDVSPQGSVIRKRGFTEVVNRFGGNCFGCHAAAKPGGTSVRDDSRLRQSAHDAHDPRLAEKTDPRCKPPSSRTRRSKGWRRWKAAQAKPAPPASR